MENETLSSASSYLVPASELIFDETNSTSGNNAASDRVLSIQSDVVLWAIIDGLLVVAILGGNTMTILALRYSRKLRSVISNMFVLSLAISDMVVGFTLPFHLAFYMTNKLGKFEHWCLLRFFLIILACCVSVWNLTAIAVDRYIAIMYPLHYTRYMNKRVAIILLGFGWTLSFILAAMPMVWNNFNTAVECEFDEVLPPWYVAGVITPLFSIVWTCLLFVYFRIWLEASRQVKQLRSTPFSDRRVSDWKSVQVVLLILGCFSLCWLPYFIVACIQMFSLFDHSSPVLYKVVFSLAVANSGMNPIIYAWKNKNFRCAFALILSCKNPDMAYREELHFRNQISHNSNRRVASPKIEVVVANKSIFTARSDSEGALASDQCSSYSSGDPALKNGHPNSYSVNSHSVDVVVATVTGKHFGSILTEFDVEGEQQEESLERCQRNASGSNAFSSSSSTGTEITDDSFEP